MNELNFGHWLWISSAQVYELMCWMVLFLFCLFQESQRVINLLQEKRLISAEGVETVRPNLHHDHKRVNCNPE